MAYDARRALVLLYGDRAPDSTTLWGWDGARWRALDTAGPGLRRHVKLAFDEARGRLVMYGGLDDSGRLFMSDTWEWDGARWHRVATSGPGARSSYALAYDRGRRRVVLFGGLSPEGPSNDTWEWDGRTWTRRADQGPSPRGEAGMIYDERTRRLVLAGGVPYERVAAEGRPAGWSLRRTAMLRDTWAWDGRGWRRLADSGIARMGALGSDPRTRIPVRVGGESDSAYHGDVWRWRENAWELVADSAVPPRHGPAVAADARRGRLVVFGGFSRERGALADLWEWDGAEWRRVGP